jgi:hypothetical protein
MTSRDHYVSRFFLSRFVDPASSVGAEPWLWYGEVRNGTVKRKAPKNIGWSRDLFAGPGGLADRGRRLEEHLAQEVEGPAAQSLREFVAAPIYQVREIPPALFRYMAWLAARSLTMKSLYESWISELDPPAQIELAEEPAPEPANLVAAPERRHVMEHPQHGTRDDVPSGEIESLRQEGWRWRFSNDDFPEMVHLQAWDFQSRFFPRLSWKVLDAPGDPYFITCDRPALRTLAPHSL